VNAYRSVLSARGSVLMYGASAWLEPAAGSGPGPRRSAMPSARAAAARTSATPAAFLGVTYFILNSLLPSGVRDLLLQAGRFETTDRSSSRSHREQSRRRLRQPVSRV